MNFLQFLGRKPSSNSKPPKRAATAQKYEGDRLNTEIQELKERPVAEKLHSEVHASQILHPTGKSDYTKLTVSKDIIVSVLKHCKKILREDVDLLSHYTKDHKVKTPSEAELVAMHYFLLRTNFFRYQFVDHATSLRNYQGILEAIDTLSEKILDNPNVLNEKGRIFVLNEEEFCQFFKMLFGRPIKLFNQRFIRKLLQELWYYVFFNQKNPQRLVNIIRHWLHGISLPVNPARIRLQRAIFEEDIKFIEKACALKLNSPIYCHINEADAMGVTPLMLCVYLKKQNLLPTLFIQGASPFIIPLTKMDDSEKYFEELKTVATKTKASEVGFNVKMPIYQKYTKNLIEFVRDNSDIKLMAHLLGLEHTKKIYSLRDSPQLYRKIEEIPDFSIQLMWKIQSKFNLIGGPPPSDVITIYKRRGSVRIDFNTINIFSNKHRPEKGKYSIIFKTKPDLTFVYIDHRNRKIIDLFGQASVEDIERRAQIFLKEGNKQNETIAQIISDQKIIKTNNGQSVRKTNFNVYFEYENIKKAQLPHYKDIVQYEKAVVDSTIIDYGKLSASENNFILKELVDQNLKVTRKKNQSKMSFELTTMQCFNLNMEHLHALCKLVSNFTDVFDRISKFLDLQKQLSDAGRRNIAEEFPVKASFELSLGVSLQMQFQNFNFSSPKQQVFELDAKLDDFEEECHPQQAFEKKHKKISTVESQLNLSFSKYLRSGDKSQESEFQDACKQYEMLLASTHDSDFVEVLSNYSSLNNSMSLNSQFTTARKREEEKPEKIQKLQWRSFKKKR